MAPSDDQGPRWNLDRHYPYSSTADPKIDEDIALLGEEAAAYAAECKGTLDTKLLHGLRKYESLRMRGATVTSYLKMKNDVDLLDNELAKRQGSAKQTLSGMYGDHLEWFELEVAKLTAESLEAQYEADPALLHYKPWIDEVKQGERYQLTEDVERALTVRMHWCSKLGVVNFFKRELSKLKVECANPLLQAVYPDEDSVNLSKMLKTMSYSSSQETRHAALVGVNASLEQFAPISAFSLSMVAGDWAIANKERKYTNLRSRRNTYNNVSDEVVDALLAGVRKKGVGLSKRFYRLKKALLKATQGLERMTWADRNAPVSPRAASEGTLDDKCSWEDAVKAVNEGYESFSPTLASMFRNMLEEERIDAPPDDGKTSGAYCAGCVPGIGPFQLMNFTGSKKDIMTLAHESGHSCHDILAYDQGYLQWHPPLTLAECASIFGEMVVFRGLLANATDDAERLSMLMEKIDSIVNSVVRQASFDRFEELVHTARLDGEVSVDACNGFWRQCMVEYYGEEGDVWDSYEGTEFLWSYVRHFHSVPFYVYAYSFADLVVGSLYGVYRKTPDGFEPKLLDLLRGGSTVGFQAALAPFGLDPSLPTFWEDALENHLGEMLAEAEGLAGKLGLV